MYMEIKDYLFKVNVTEDTVKITVKLDGKEQFLVDEHLTTDDEKRCWTAEKLYSTLLKFSILSKNELLEIAK